MLQRVTERRLADADHGVLRGRRGVCHWTRLTRYGGLLVWIALWVIVGILNLIRWWTCNQCSLLKVAKLEPGVRLLQQHLRGYFEYAAGMPYRTEFAYSPAKRWQGEQRYYRSLKSQANDEYVSYVLNGILLYLDCLRLDVIYCVICKLLNNT